MTAIRRNVVTDATARARYVEGVMALKADFLGPTTTQLGIAGPSRPVSTYDLFVVWHHLAMFRLTPPTQSERNAAHSGPAFLPWHRLMLVQLELQMQRVLGDDTVGLPYWDWAADGALSPAQQRTAPLWTAAGMGGTGNPVADGPFAHDPANAAAFRIRIESGASGRLRSTDRGLRRSLGTDTATLPTKAQVAAALAQPTYDTPPWGPTSRGFRNQLEGWRPNPPGLHNRVHVWIGGDMAPASSPNDPVFYLNHANVDRLWEAWMQTNGRTYVPGPGESAALAGHRLNDALYNVLATGVTRPADLLDQTELATYDSLQP